MKDDSNRSLRRMNRKSRSAVDRTVEVDSSAFFAEDPSPTPPPRKKPGSSAPRRSGAPAQAAAAAPSEIRQDPADSAGHPQRGFAGAAVAHPDAAGAVSGHSGGAAAPALAAGQALSGVQCARQGVPCVLGVPVRLHGAGLCLGPAGSDRAGQHDQRSAHRCRGQQDHQGAFRHLPQRRGHPW